LVLNNIATQYAGQIAIIRTYSTGGSPPFYNETAYQKMHVYPPPYRYNSSWVYATPWLYVDGYRDAAYFASTWNTEISQQLLVPSDLEISLNGTFEQTTNMLSLQIGISNTGTNSISGRFYAVLTEDDIQWSAPNGENTHHDIPRIYWPNANGQEISVSPGILKNVNIIWNIDSTYDQTKLKIIAYMQDYTMQPDSIYIISQGAVSNFLQLQPPVFVSTENNNVIAGFKLEQNYPNPFNPKTTIEFSIPSKSHVNLTIYNALGEQINTLISEDLASGNYSTNWDASSFASGVYYYKLSVGDPSTGSGSTFVQTRKLILLK